MRKTIEINGSNVLNLAHAMDKALEANSEFVEFEGEKIPTPVVGEILKRVACSIIAETLVESLAPPTDIEREVPKGEVVH